MTKPTIHMNGSGKQHLTEQYTNVTNALNAALNALSEAYPHGRDYYVQGPEAIDAAVREHDARIEAVRTVYKDMLQMLRHVANSN